jgi:hypothetical protein
MVLVKRPSIIPICDVIDILASQRLITLFVKDDKYC